MSKLNEPVAMVYVSAMNVVDDTEVGHHVPAEQGISIYMGWGLISLPVKLHSNYWF